MMIRTLYKTCFVSELLVEHRLELAELVKELPKGVADMVRPTSVLFLEEVTDEDGITYEVVFRTSNVRIVVGRYGDYNEPIPACLS